MSLPASSDRPIILHHYPTSPFAEKVRLMLGFKGLRWKSVVIPVIMPKPDLVALTGGYRKTPVLQIGADVYCDTALIARVLDRVSSSSALISESQPASAAMIAAWADSTWFSACVAHAMQPEGVRSLFPDAGDATLAAFAADRKSFRGTGNALRMPLAMATPLIRERLAQLELQLAHRSNPFLLGQQACIADFAVYHPLWFIQQARAVAGVLDAYPQVLGWMKRVAAFGHGQSEPMDSGEAIVIARLNAGGQEGLSLTGRRVQIAATDYGTDPTAGVLVEETDDEWVIARNDTRAGLLRVHFPRAGFALTPI